jgi:transposase
MQAKFEKEITTLEAQLEEQLKAWQGNQQQNLSTIPGLGKRAVAILIVYTDGFKKISNYRQLIALAGLAPRDMQVVRLYEVERGYVKWEMAICEKYCTCVRCRRSGTTKHARMFTAD